MRSLDLPQILYQPFAATGDKNTILNSPSSDDPQRANLQTGFPAITQIPIANGGIPPERMDFNGLGYLLSSFYFFTQCGGVYTFHQDVSNAIGGYPFGAVLYYTDSNGTTYEVRSLLENNTFDFVTTPSYIDDEHWAYVSSTPITQDTSASSTSNVFSTAAAQSLLNTVVHKTGNETISGVKTFIADNIIHKNTKATIANPPSNVSYCFTDYTDNNNERIGVIGSQINSDGWHGTYLQAGNEGNIHILTDGTDAITYAPPCDAFGSIVTTTGINKAQNGYVKLGNGIIIQWGWYKVNNSANTTITFPTAFSGNSTYAVSTDIYCSDNNRERPFTVKTKTASNITVYNYFSGGTNYCFIIAIGY